MVEDASRPWSRVIGSRLRDARHARRLTLDELAQLSGLTKGFLSKVERGVASPAPPTMERICTALGVDLDTLVEPAHGVLVTDGVPLPGFDGREGIVERMLTPQTERRLRVGVSDFVKGGHVGPQTISQADVFFVHVQSGAFVLTVDGEEHRLRAGQSFTYDPRLEHSFTVIEDGRAIWAAVPTSRASTPLVTGPTDRPSVE